MMRIPGKTAFWLLVPGALSAALVTDLDRSEIFRGERVTLSLRFEAERFVYPKLSETCGVPILFSRSAETGAADAEHPQRRYVLQYVFAPQQDCTVAPVTLAIDDRNETTKPLRVKVRADGPDPNPEFDFRVEVPKKNVRVGEPFLVVYTFRKRHNHDGVDFEYVPPKLQNLWVKQRQSARAVEEGEYTLVRERYVMAAQRSGTLTIGEAAMKVAKRAYKRDPWGQWMPVLEWREYYAEPVEITAEPLPADVRLTGTFTLQSSVDANHTEVGKPVDLSIHIRGSGNFEDIVPYDVTIPGVTIFGGDPIIKDYLEQGEYKGGWLQKMQLVSDTNYTIPSFTFRYFDTASGAVLTRATEPIRVWVTGAPAREAEQNLTKMIPIGEPMLYDFWNIAAGFALAGFGLGVAVTLLFRRLRFRRRTTQKQGDLRAALVALFKHLDDPDARRSAAAVERHLYEGKAGPDEKALRDVLQRLSEKK